MRRTAQLHSRPPAEAVRANDYSWTSLISVASLMSVAFGASVIVTPLYPLYERKFDFSEVVVTLIYATYVVGNVVALLFLGQLSDQIGRKRVGLAALGSCTVGVVVFLFASASAWLFVGRFVVGLAVGVVSGTATAWLIELSSRSRATVVSTAANLAGIAIGPIIGGTLAAYAPKPLMLPFLVYLGLLAIVATAIRATRDPSRGHVSRFQDLHLRPRIGVPRERLREFATPAITGFVIFALAGLYFALISTILVKDLHQQNPAVAGAIVAELALVAVAAIALSRRASPPATMRAGLALLFPAVGLVVAAQAARSLVTLVVAAGFAGLALGLGYVGSLKVANRVAPDEHRGAVASSYFLCCFVGNSVPVIGVGVIATLTTLLTATIVLACLVAVLSAGALCWFHLASPTIS